MEMKLELKNTERTDYYYAEAIKTLRTNIQFCGSSLKTILFTSTCQMRERAIRPLP